VVAAAPQLITDRSLASAGDAFDEVIPPAHVLENTDQTWAIRRVTQVGPEFDPLGGRLPGRPRP
jgi:hypothetical protein